MAGALARARERRAVEPRVIARYARIVRRARRVAARLSGVPRAELAAAIGIVDGLAARGELTPRRMPAAFMTLRRNTAVWRRGVVPAPGRRFRFGRDPAVFQYFPGRGLAFHPLASFGRLNAMAGRCLYRRGGGSPSSRRCAREPLRHGLDRLAGLAATRAGFTAWEYLVPFGGGTPPWVSGMAQAVAIQAYVRGATALGARRWQAVARDAVRAFDEPPPAGVRVAVPGGSDFLMYSFAPSLRIVNGLLQSVLALRDMAQLTHSALARRLLHAAEPVARAAVAAADTGAWSLYSQGGAEAPLGYHRLVTRQLAQLCVRLREPAYCAAHRRFAAYLRRSPDVALRWPVRARAGTAAPVRFTLSKGALVRIRIVRARRVVLSLALRAARGPHRVPWLVRGAGRYALRLTAVGPAGNRAVRRATLEALAPRRPAAPSKRRPRGRRDRGRPRPAPSPPPVTETVPAPAPAPATGTTPVDASPPTPAGEAVEPSAPDAEAGPPAVSAGPAPAAAG